MFTASSMSFKSKSNFLQLIFIVFMNREEELYMILIDIMRSPEMIKALCGSSLKKKLQ